MLGHLSILQYAYKWRFPFLSLNILKLIEGLSNPSNGGNVRAMPRTPGDLSPTKGG